MKKYLVITADTNDGDYITALNEITSKQLFLIQPMIDAIKAFKPLMVINGNTLLIILMEILLEKI